VAGVLAHAPELTLLYAPYANSYRRLQPGTWAPAAVTWGVDNRTVMVRVCGAPARSRIELRLPGADVNPYLAFAALVASGLAGVRRDLEPPPPVVGDAYAAGGAPLPRSVGEAAAALRRSAVAAEAFGADVRDHLAALGEHEADLERRQVTDRDRARCFESA
jgi:glutamine synthetase